MDVSGDVADLMVKESIQLTEASIKLLAAGSKNLAALLWALAKDNKKLVGKTGMGRLLRESKELKVFHIKESDLTEFKAFAKKNVLFAVVKDKRRTDGMVDLVTNVDFVSQVNLFMERRGYGVPARGKEDGEPKKAAPRAQPGSSSPQRGSGSTQSQSERRTTRTTDTPAKVGDIPTVKGRLAALRAASEGMKEPGKAPQRQAPKRPPKTR
ncbi:PcfB family protein [Colidextribacter sp. OB.20]|uniref:DUF3801 domain-containing protein n=1 Tax=Colidextribacter sp. OB.20 TaxID=2304568 RepID=UPI00136E8980|nr:DUF3801 domain-containing protein [Colidextribacter sp. OB.20]NBI11703.1 PcfB family protein [Colidextribacter sp. OB.20]